MSIFSTIASAAVSSSPFSFSSTTNTNSNTNPTGPSFGDTLQNAIGNVNSLQLNANSMSQDFATGKTSDVHGVMIATEQATLALQLATQVRNKVVEAYQQVMQISM
jgi:flagellar hook-basal body complex protein FliE